MHEELKQTRSDMIIEFMRELKKLSTADRAILKRNAGKLIGESRGGAMDIFYLKVPRGVPIWQEEIWFAVATFFAGSKVQLTESEKVMPAEHTNFGWTLRHLLRNRERGNRQDIKVRVLLDSQIDTRNNFFFVQMRRFIFLAENNYVPVDWEKLLLDLISWNHPSRYIQKTWARNYFIGTKE